MTKPKLINEAFEITGYWWLPENPKHTIVGTLYHTNEQIHLELVGAFEDIPNMLQNPKDFPIILGFSNKGENITLNKCYLNQYQFSMGFPTSSYRIITLFIGVHFNTPLNIKFKSISSSTFYLDEWLGKSGFHFSTIEELIKSKVISVKHESPKEIISILDDKTKIIFSFEGDYDIIPKKFQEITLRQSAFVTVEFDDDRDFSYCHMFTNYLRNFLSLAVSKPVYPLILKGKTNENKIIENNQEKFPTVLIYYNFLDMPEKPRDLIRENMFFSFDDVSDNLEFCLKNWFSKADNLEPVYNLYFGLVYTKHLYINQEFQSLIHGLESYHRLMVGGMDIPEEEHEKKINNIIQGCNQEYKDWLKEELQYSNELTLKRRLEVLLERFPDVLENYPLEGKKFIRRIVDTRNYLTHYDKQLKPRMASDDEKIILNKRMMILLEACLLTELGFSEEKIKILIQRRKEIEALYQNIQNKADALTKHGIGLASIGKHTEALVKYDDALKIDSEYAEALINKGVSYHRLNKLTESMNCFDKVLSKDKKNVLALYNKAVVLMERNDHKTSLDLYTQVLEIEPKFVKALVNKGILLAQDGEYPEAILCFDEAIKIEPFYANAFVNKGNTLQQMGDVKSALLNFKKALEIEPNQIQALFNMGITHYFTGNYILAIICYNAALQLKPNNIPVLLNKGAVLLDYKKEKEALETYEEILKIDPENPNALTRKGIILLQKGQTTEGNKLFDDALKLDPNNHLALLNKGIFYSNSGYPQKAIDEYYDKILKDNPKDANAIYDKACAKSLLKEEKDAIDLLKQAIQFEPKCKQSAKTDKDFENIRNNEEFIKLVED